MFDDFMINTWISASIIAAVAGGVGFFIVIRGSLFAAHALPLGAFPGAAAANLLGINPLWGLLVFSGLGVLGINELGRRGRHDVATALSLVMLLGLGALFLSMTTEYSQAVYALLFGEVLGVSSADLTPVAAVSAISVALTVLLYRPLLLSSICADLGEARGVSARQMEVLFLTVVALAAAMALPIVGALLVFSLMVGPASAARALTNRPLRAIALSAGISVVTVWASIALSFASDWPIGFFVGGLSAAEDRWRADLDLDRGRSPMSIAHGRGVMTGLSEIRTRQIHWSWRGQVVTLGVDEAGQGPPVLFLPALSSISTRREMHPLMQHLAATAKVIASDWPAFGDLPRPAAAWTPDALSAFLDHLLRQELPPLHAAVAAGHAASYALHHAATHPGDLGRLALLAPTWRGPLPTMAGGDRPLFRTIRRAIAVPILGQLLYRANVNRFVVLMMAAGHVYSAKDFLSGDLLQQKRAVIRAPGARFGSAAFVTGGLDRISSRAEFLDLAQEAGVPTLVIYGAETPPKSRAEIEAVSRLAGIQSAVMPRGKLGLHEEFPDDMLPPLLKFLQS